MITQDGPGRTAEGGQHPDQTKPENITIAVDASGDIYWNNKLIADISTELIDQVKVVAVRKPQPEIHIRADKERALRPSAG